MIGPRLVVIHLTQRKTGAALCIPVHAELAAIIEAPPSDNLTFLVTRDSSPVADAGFGNLFREWCNEAGLPKQCSAHGPRKAACRRLAEAGCSAPEIMAISGHASLREVQRYCAAADQARMARSAMATVAMSTSLWFRSITTADQRSQGCRSVPRCSHDITPHPSDLIASMSVISIDRLPSRTTPLSCHVCRCLLTLSRVAPTIPASSF